MALTANASYDFSSGSYSVVALDTMTVQADILAIHPDSVARCLPGMPLILERYGADTVTLIGAAPPHAVVRQLSVGTGSNPNDIALAPGSGRGVVARLNDPVAAVVDAAAGTMAPEGIDLSAFADADGIPEAGAVIAAAGKVFIALQLLDRNTAFFDPTGPGKLAVFDGATLAPVDAVPATAGVDAVTLTGANPGGRMQLAPEDEGTILVGEVGFYGQLDGGIEGVDAETFAATGFLVTEASLGGDIAAWVVADAHTGYAVVAKPGMTGDALVRFDPSDGTVTAGAIAERGAYTMTDMALAPGGKLLVTDRTTDRSGLLVVDVATGALLREAPLPTGLAPFSVCVLR